MGKRKDLEWKEQTEMQFDESDTAEEERSWEQSSFVT